MTPAKPRAASRPAKANAVGARQRPRSAKSTLAESVISAELAEAMLGTMAEGVVVYGLDGKPLYCNQRSVEITGLTLEMRRSMSLEDLAKGVLREDGTPETPETLASQVTLRTGERTAALSGIVTESGEMRWLEATAAPMYRAGSSKLFAVCLVLRDITEARAAETALKASEEMKSAVMAASVDAILMLDEQGAIVELNRSAELLYKTTRAAIGEKLESFIPWRDRQVWAQIIERLQGDPKHFRGRRLTGTGQRSDGSEFPLEATIDSLEAGGHQMFVTFIRDVTERRAAERRLADARDAALRASVVKSEFLATMSHEIRTPMNGVIGSLDLILDSDLPDDQRELATIARTSAHDLLAIIDDILDLSKIEADKLDSQSIEFDLAAIVEGVTDIVAVPARRKGLALSCFVDPRAPSAVRGDARLLRQVLVNLVGNAVKFTDKGEVAVRAELQPSDDGHARVQFAVSDTGIGIPADALEKLFEPFTQVDGSSTRAHGGTGLGLAISSRLVRLMGGDLVVDSGVGRGSTFSFTVPFEVPERAAGPTYGPMSQARPLRVLIVESTASAAEAIDRYLRAWGMITTRTASPEDALRRCTSAPAGEAFDVALVALSPDDDGGGVFAARLRESAGDDGVFVVALLDIGDRLPDSAVGPDGTFDAVVAKPIKQSRLYDALSGVNHSQDAAPAVDDGLPAAAVLRGLRVLIAEDNPVNQQVLLRQAGRLGLVASAVENGQAALEALAQGGFDAVLMDCQMPVMDGYAAARAIRARESGGERTPIVAVTANAMREDYDRCRDAGMDDFVPKPVTLAALANAIERAVLASREQPEGVGGVNPQELVPSAPDEDFGIDRATLAALQEDVGGSAALSRIIRLFLEQLDPQADEITQAAAGGELESVARTAHRMKSSSATLGATALASVLEQIEAAGNDGDADAVEKLRPALAGAVTRVRTAFEGVMEGLEATK